MEEKSSFWMFRISNTIVGVHTTEPPTDRQWDEYVSTAKKLSAELGFDEMRALSITDGGAPSGEQRAIINDLLGGRSVLIAIVSSSAMVRSVVTALSWFNPKIKTFAPSRVRDALTHIGFAQSDVSKLCHRLRPLTGSVQAVRSALLELDQVGREAHS
jgi:hypothetical protein